ncbi:formylglycine-generating enzyme family protein [Collimonas fungivorans]|nr:formylglycine-generating enzyme family protein [Collimonas fungivorans]
MFRRSLRYILPAVLAFIFNLAHADGEANKPGTVFQDCTEACPKMVWLPTGSFSMGSSATESGRFGNEGPVHTVTIAYPLAVGQTDVTRGEFAQFVQETGYSAEGDCYAWEKANTFFSTEVWNVAADRSWRKPGYAQDDSHPVVCVNLADVKAYTGWLSAKTKKPYRLLTEAEWEYAARAGTTSIRYWGDDAVMTCQFANVADHSWQPTSVANKEAAFNCADNFAHSSPAASFQPNQFGLYDMLGNVWQWTSDCYTDNYAASPADGKPTMSGPCTGRTLRGGSWDFGPRFVRAARRLRTPPAFRKNQVGFRVALAVSSSAAVSSAAP